MDCRGDGINVSSSEVGISRQRAVDGGFRLDINPI